MPPNRPLPPSGKQYWWPQNLPLGDYSIQNYVQAFESIGYSVTTDDSLEAGKEKVAVYSLNGVAKHAARQLPDGTWTSKLGEEEDIMHADLAALESMGYGLVTVFLERPIA